MTRHIASVRWRPVEGPGEDICRLDELADGWALTGHAEFPGDLGWAALSYTVQLDGRWRTLGATVRGTHGGRPVDLTISRGRFWTANGALQTHLGPAADIDLSFTPATNLMPLRRLGDRPMQVSAAWLRFPDLELARLDQTYTPLGEGRVGYASPGFETELTVDPSGFITDYAGLWTGVVTDAG